MKMKAVVRIVKGLIFVLIGLSMIGCERVKEVENLNVQDTKPVVEEKIENCEYCGYEKDNGECGACEGYEASAHLFDDGLNDTTRAIFEDHYKNCTFAHTPIYTSQEVTEPKAVCYTCGIEVDEATAHYNGRSYRCDGCYWAEQGLETPNAEATNCDACGTNNIEVMDSAGGYICNECGHCN